MDPTTAAAAVPLPAIRSKLAAVPAGEAREIVLSRLVSEVYRESTPPLRAGLLECLLRPVRPLGLVAIAAGAFSSFLYREHWSRFHVSLDEALRVTSDQVYELARFVDQVQPEAFRQVAALLTENPVSLQTLSGSVLLMALGLWLPSAGRDRP